jgi:translation initiation factor IF-3
VLRFCVVVSTYPSIYYEESLVRKGKAIAATDYRINREIRAREVRLIVEEDKEGVPTSRNVGVVTLERALEIAAEVGMDLVEVAPDANPPVCRVMDYGKFQYEQQRKERKARKNQVKVEIKEIQLKPKTDDYHIGFKLKQAREWLEAGMKVRVRVRFRGREITHSHLGRETLDEIKILLADVGQVEQHPNMEGRDMLMVLAPLGEKK